MHEIFKKIFNQSHNQNNLKIIGIRMILIPVIYVIVKFVWNFRNVYCAVFTLDAYVIQSHDAFRPHFPKFFLCSDPETIRHNLIKRYKFDISIQKKIIRTDKNLIETDFLFGKWNSLKNIHLNIWDRQKKIKLIQIPKVLRLHLIS